MPEHEHELVMPFIVVTSVGGPYADDAYVAGYEAGRLDQFLDRTQVPSMMVRTDNVLQLDLIAMRHGWTLTATDVGDGWSNVEFHKR